MTDFVLIFALSRTRYWENFECRAFGADGAPADNANVLPAVVVLRDGINHRRIGQLAALRPDTTAYVIEHTVAHQNLKVEFQRKRIAYDLIGRFNHQPGNVILTNLVSLIGTETCEMSKQNAAKHFINRKNAAVRLRLISTFSQLHDALKYGSEGADVQAQIAQLVADHPMIAAIQTRIEAGESLQAVTDAFRNGSIEVGHQ